VQNAVPGTPLRPTPTDARIPVILIQRTLSASATTSTTSPSEPALYGWTLLLPKHWAPALLASLAYTGTRVGGQRERAHQAFEAGAPYFPRDFPCTPSYAAFAAERAARERARWDRTPPAKRASWATLGTRSPWQPDWEVVLGGRTRADAVEGAGGEEGDFVQTQREPPVSSSAPPPPYVEPWLLRGPDVRKIADAAAGMLNPAAALWDALNALRRRRGMAALPSGADAVEGLMRGALVRVRVRLADRGAPADNAVVYEVLDGEVARWRKEKWERRPGLGLPVDGLDDEESEGGDRDEDEHEELLVGPRA
jgi:ribonuclease P/MRP protein subunit POP1